MPVRPFLTVLGLTSLLLTGCKPPAQPAAPAANPDTPPTEAAGVDLNRLQQAEQTARTTPFPLAQLLAGDQPALRAALGEQPWLPADELVAALKARAVPSYNDLLQAFALDQAPCTWRAWPLPQDNPFAATADQVSCLIPMTRTPVIGSDDRPTGETHLVGPEYIFLVAPADPDPVTLLSVDGQSVIQENPAGAEVSAAFQRDLVLARLAVSWLIQTDPAWQQRDKEGAAQAAQTQSQGQASEQRGAQFQPVVAAIARWRDLNQGTRPRRLEDLGRHGLGLLSSPSLLHWKDAQGRLSQETMLYFSRPLLLPQRGLAVMLAAPVANPDGTRSVASSSGKTADIPDAEFIDAQRSQPAE